MNKGFIVQKAMQADVMNEKDIMLLCDSPFIIRLFETYNSAKMLHFLMEAALGGELYATYQRRQMHGDAKCASYYSAGVVNAFEHLHGHHVIYRDLKPENLLLNKHGHLRLTDMGLAKRVIGMTFTTCGTPDYFAPEIIASSGHNYAVDWWTLGILIFELMCGAPPFEADDPMATYKKIWKGIEYISFPSTCEGPVEDLIKALCKQEPSHRLPMKKNGIQSLKNHAWYAGFSWTGFEALTMTPPYLPK